MSLIGVLLVLFGLLIVTFGAGLIVSIVGMLRLMIFDKVADGIKALRRRLAL